MKKELDFQFNHIVDNITEKGLRESTLDAFKNLNIYNEMMSITDDVANQNTILTNFRRILLDTLSYNFKTKRPALHASSLIIFQKGVQAGGIVERVIDNLEIDLSQSSIYFFNETWQAIAFARITEKTVNKNSLSVRLLNILVGKIVTLINLNKIVGKNLDLRYFEFRKGDKKLSLAEKDQIVREFRKGDFDNYVKVTEIRE